MKAGCERGILFHQIKLKDADKFPLKRRIKYDVRNKSNYYNASDFIFY